MLRLVNITKVFRTTEVETHALDGVSLEIASGEFVAIMGPSGCGKSTLLSILGLLDTATSGEYWLLGEQIAQSSEARFTSIRRQHIGFVFQNFNLVEDLNVAQNVEVGLLYRGVARQERQRRISAALDRVGLSHRARHFPQQLSGGQQQRVAVARALVASPKLILADEPTGNLDSENGDSVMQLLTDIASQGTSVVMVTHSPAYAAQTSRTIRLLDGRIHAPEALAA